MFLSKTPSRSNQSACKTDKRIHCAQDQAKNLWERGHEARSLTAPLGNMS